jgi:hypothetical protein
MRSRVSSLRREALQCCPACAASVGVDRRRRSGGRPAWAWVGLLGAVAGLVPVAAMNGGGGGVAQAAPPPAASQRPGPVPQQPPSQPSRPDTPAERRETRPRVEWRDSRALGTPNAGALENGVQLPAQGPGFYTYDPITQAPPGGDDRTWGTATLVREVLDLGEWWSRTHPRQPRLGVGDLAREHGGYFAGTEVGHLSHQNGLDVDIRLVRADGTERQVDAASYDRELTQAVVDRLVARGADLVLIGPSLDLHGPAGVVMRWPNHDDHLHVRFPDPDGLGN